MRASSTESHRPLQLTKSILQACLPLCAVPWSHNLLHHYPCQMSLDREALTHALHLPLQICGVAKPADVLPLVQALSQVHAAGVCLLDISAESIWVTADGSATFLDFSMAHEFIPGDAEHVCALPVLQLTQQLVAPEVLRARLAHDISGRLAPFSGPKVHSVLFLEVSCCSLYSMPHPTSQ